MSDFHGEPTGLLENQFLQLEYLVNATRIVRLTPAGKTNLFVDLGLHPLQTQYGNFYFRGGHRLWHSPEVMPRTYLPDREGAITREVENGIRIGQPAEDWSHIAKSLEIRLDPGQPRVTVQHELRNEGAWAADLAPWALTMLRPGGVAIFPQPSGNVDAAGLLPNRQITLWPYASISDSRLTWRDDFVLIHAEPKLPPFKLGYFNRHGWMGYWLEGILFIKRFETSSHPGSYPDGGCNVESYCNDKFIELETLGPLTRLEPGATVVHTETWEIHAGLEGDLIPSEIKDIVITM